MISCNSAFEQSNLDLWRYINVLLLLLLLLLLFLLLLLLLLYKLDNPCPRVDATM